MAGVPVSPVGQGPVTQPDTNPVDAKTGQSATWLIQLLNDLRTGVIKVSNSGTTAQRPVDPLLGELYYDTSVISSGSIGTYFFCDTIRDANTSTPAHWTALGPGSGSAVSITAAPPINVTPDPITGAGIVGHDASGVTPGTYGAGTKIPQFTVEPDGHLTAAGERDACRCVTDIVPPSMYQFPSNNVLGFDITKDDTIIGPYARVTVLATLGDGVTALYGGGIAGDQGDGIYNPVDDRIYFLSRKYTTLISPGVFDLTTWHNMFVKWNWHTLAIELEVELPAGWCVSEGVGGPGGSACPGSASTIVDLTDTTAWLVNLATSEVNAYELSGMTIIYSAAPGDAFVDNYFTGLAIVSGANRVVVLKDNPAGDLHMLQITGPAAANFVDLGVMMSATDPYIPTIAETGEIRRFWLPEKNLLFLYCPPTFAVAQPLADIFDLSLGPVTGAHVILINSILGILDITRPHWDTFLNRIYGLVGAGGEAEITTSGYIQRLFGSGGNYSFGFPLGGSLLMWSTVFQGGGEFIPATNSNPNIADKNYTTTNVTAGSDTWTFDDFQTVIVMRRFLGFPDPATVTF